jgi:chromosome segregation ATPase
MEQKQEQTEEEIIVEVADTLDGQHFNIVVYPSRVIVTRVAGKTHGTRRYTNDLQTASLQQQVKELKEEVESKKESLRIQMHQVNDQQSRITVLEEAIERVKDLCANQLGNFMSVQEVLSALSGKESNG